MRQSNNALYSVAVGAAQTCVDAAVVLKAVVKDTITGHVTVNHPLRRVYYSAVSAVLFFAPLFLMSLTYSLIVWKVWSRQRPGELTTSGLQLENKLRKQVSSQTRIGTICNRRRATRQSGEFLGMSPSVVCNVVAPYVQT